MPARCIGDVGCYSRKLTRGAAQNGSPPVPKGKNSVWSGTFYGNPAGWLKNERLD
jgi:hypothetical protein